MSKPTNLKQYKKSQEYRDKVFKSLEINIEILKLNASGLRRRGSIVKLEKLSKILKKINKLLDD